MTEKNYFVHESSYVDEGVEIGEGTKIVHRSHRYAQFCMSDAVERTQRVSYADTGDHPGVHLAIGGNFVSRPEADEAGVGDLHVDLLVYSQQGVTSRNICRLETIPIRR